MSHNPHNPGSKQTLYCSFCGKSQHEVKKLIVGPVAFICDECVVLCVDIIKSTPPLTGYTAGAIAKRGRR